MGTTKKALADELGVTKQTVANYIQRLDLADHVTREGQADVIDDYAASALAAAIGTDKAPADEAAPPTNVIDAQEARIADLKAELDRAKADYEARIADLSAELGRTRDKLEASQAKLVEASERNGELAGELAEIAKRQQIIAATPWWRRWSLATKLLGSGEVR